ncbi:transposase [Candidatus Accumulibacter phosphatis]|uniref:transposase n=1 Tax=Candidatus Accumulibacter phosphatis TaxID=327160 RepID=UPI003D7C173A
MPRASRIGWCRCRRPLTHSCADSGRATAIPFCGFPIGTAAWRVHAQPGHRFTLPAEWRGLAAAHADVVFDSWMRCAWETVHRFSQNDRQLQGTPGAIAVLHTHSRRLDFHPPVHLVVPAAAVDAAKPRGDASGAARTAPTCSTRRQWPRSFGQECWRRSRRPALACRRDIRGNGWRTANRWAAARRP